MIERKLTPLTAKLFWVLVLVLALVLSWDKA